MAPSSADDRSTTGNPTPTREPKRYNLRSRRSESSTDKEQQQMPISNSSPRVEAFDDQPRPDVQRTIDFVAVRNRITNIEALCMQYDNIQRQQPNNDIKEWKDRALLHQNLLDDYLELPLLSQQCLGQDHLPRFWRDRSPRIWNGIHSFLDVLSKKHDPYLVPFIYKAYEALNALRERMHALSECMHALEKSWCKSLGDLARFALGAGEDKEMWTCIAHRWYCLASLQAPTEGVFYHHMAVIAEPIQQLCLFAKSLCVPKPFDDARNHMVMWINKQLLSTTGLAPVDAAFLEVHAILISGKNGTKLKASMEKYMDLVGNHIDQSAHNWLETGSDIAIALACSLIGYGSVTHIMGKVVCQPSGVTETAGDGQDENFEAALLFSLRHYELVVEKPGDNGLPFVHIFLVFVNFISKFLDAIAHLKEHFPWKQTAKMLNDLRCNSTVHMSEDFPWDSFTNPLFEDFKLRELIFTQGLYPGDWFCDARVDDFGAFIEDPMPMNQRRERVLWLGWRLAWCGKWLTCDKRTGEFGVATPFATL